MRDEIGFVGITMVDGFLLVGEMGIFRVGLISFEEDEIIGFNGIECWLLVGLMSSIWFDSLEDLDLMLLLIDESLGLLSMFCLLTLENVAEEVALFGGLVEIGSIVFKNGGDGFFRLFLRGFLLLDRCGRMEYGLLLMWFDRKYWGFISLCCL